jgi:hypothetical protein
VEKTFIVTSNPGTEYKATIITDSVISKECKNVNTLNEYDVNIVDISDNKLKVNCAKPYFEVPEKGMNLTICYAKYDKGAITVDDLECRMSELVFTTNHYACPSIMKYKVTPKNSLVNVHGIIGSACYTDDGEIVGMLNNCDSTNDLYIVPIYTIYKLLTNKPSFLLIDYIMVNNHVQVTNNYRIQQELRKNDYLIFVDDHEIINGKIYCETTNTNIPFQTFILMNYSEGQEINMLVERKKKEEHVKVILKSYNDYLYVPYTNVRRCKKYNGKEYVELSMELLKLFATSKNIDEVAGYCIHHRKYRNSNASVVVQLDDSTINVVTNCVNINELNDKKRITLL